MPDINIRGELWDNDSADILRWWGWRDLTAPGDIAAALAEAGDEPVTVVVNSPGGDMTVGGEIRSMLRRHAPGATALIQGHCASAATLAISACRTIRCEPGALLCYHNPRGGAEGDYHALEGAAEGMRNARDCILEMYEARAGLKATREQLIELMDRDTWITPTQALSYGLIDEIVPASEGADAEVDAMIAAAGDRIRLTAEMRARYRAHIAAERERSAQEDKAARVRARLRTLAGY